jgi:sugar lactone lactonase YvrE
MRTKRLSLVSLFSLLLTTSCLDHRELASPNQLQVQDFASRLAAPLGMVVDNRGWIWVTEVAAGRVSVITPDGKSYPAITGFTVALSPENTPDGLNHLAFRDGVLYILHGVDEKMYKANVSSFKPGDQPMTADKLDNEPIGQFVLNYKFTEDTNDSNLYNLTFGPDGDLYIADAGANAIIRRTKTGDLSVFATFPNFKVGSIPAQVVPTGIVFDGTKFLVTNLVGYPFPAGQSKIYQVDTNGTVSVYKDGFTSLVDIILGADKRPIVVSVAEFGAQGPIPNTGKIISTVGGQTTTLLQALNLPTSIVAGAANTYYFSSLVDGTVKKITY